MRKEDIQHLTYSGIKKELAKENRAATIMSILPVGSIFLLFMPILIAALLSAVSTAGRIFILALIVLFGGIFGILVFSIIRTTRCINKNKFTVVEDTVTSVRTEYVPYSYNSKVILFPKKRKALEDKISGKLSDKFATKKYKPRMTLSHTDNCTVFLEKNGYFVGGKGTDNYYEAGDTVYAVCFDFKDTPVKLYNTKMYLYKE